MIRVLAILCNLYILATPAQAVPHCEMHDPLIAKLAKGFGEVQQSMAIDAAGRMIEVTANLETGTWTMLMTTPSGPTCIIASGWAYEFVAEPLGVDG